MDCLRFLALSILVVVILVSAGCGDEATIVISNGNGAIIYTTHTSAKN